MVELFWRLNSENGLFLWIIIEKLNSDSKFSSIKGRAILEQRNSYIDLNVANPMEDVFFFDLAPKARVRIFLEIFELILQSAQSQACHKCDQIQSNTCQDVRFILIKLTLTSTMSKKSKAAISDALSQLMDKESLSSEDVTLFQTLRSTPNPEYANEGLPNIGNTCFLNSVLQLLYSSEDFRNDLQEDSPNKIESAIASIFTMITQATPASKDKEYKLQVLVYLLEAANPQYSLYSQQDSIEFLLLIINEIHSTKPTITTIFELEYDFWCECPAKNAAHFKELYLSENQSTCATCQKPTKIMLTLAPNYLIFIGKNTQTFNKDKKKDFNEGNIQYAFSSAVIYYGNGRSGHYTSYRKSKDGNFYLFNDEYVSKKDQIWGVPLISIYKKIWESTIQRLKQIDIDQRKIYKANIDVIQKIMPKNNRKVLIKRSIYYVIKGKKQENSNGQYSVVVEISNTLNYIIFKQANIRTETPKPKDQAFQNQKKEQQAAKHCEMRFLIKSQRDQKNIIHGFILDNIEKRFFDWFENDDGFKSDKANFYKKDYECSEIKFQTEKGQLIYKIEDKTPK